MGNGATGTTPGIEPTEGSLSSLLGALGIANGTAAGIATITQGLGVVQDEGGIGCQGTADVFSPPKVPGGYGVEQVSDTFVEGPGVTLFDTNSVAPVVVGHGVKHVVGTGAIGTGKTTPGEPPTIIPFTIGRACAHGTQATVGGHGMEVIACGAIQGHCSSGSCILCSGTMDS